MPPIDSYPVFIHTRAFDARWHGVGLDDADLQRLQVLVGTDPAAGDVIEGTHGLRKLRFAAPGRGKSSGVRVCYAAFPAYRVILLYLVYPKSRKADLSAREKKVIAGWLEAFEAGLEAAPGRVGVDRSSAERGTP